MATKVGICNLALRNLGAARISAITEDVESARILNDVYDDILKEVLRAHPWNFAIKRVALVELDGEPVFDYSHWFQLPADCLRVIRMSVNEPFKIEADVLLTDESTAKIKYIAKITDTSKYDSGFVTAFAARLAAEIAYPILNDSRVEETKYKLYLEKLSQAKSADAQEGTTEAIDESSWLESRE